MKKIIWVLVIILIILVGCFLYKSNGVKVKESDNGSKDEVITVDAKCENNKDISAEKCGDFIDTWYGYHSERLSVSRDELDKMTTFLYFGSNSTASPGLVLYRVDFYVNYGENIRLRAHDSFPLSVPPKLDPPYPSLEVKRDNSPLSNNDIEKIGKSQAWYSNITNFPVNQLAYQNKKEIEEDINSKYLNKDIVSITYELGFDRNGNPSARLSGTDAGEKNCYSGEHNLITKVGEIHWSSPCQVN